MKKENTNLSRRNFLTKGSAVAVVASIITIEAKAVISNEESSAIVENTNFFAGVPVTTLDVQTVLNKTLPSRQNTLGTDYVNIKEYPITGVDITNALNSAIASLNTPGSKGGQILIPHGTWTSNGGHDFVPSISIEGTGLNGNPGQYGTEVKLKSNSRYGYMFRITTGNQHCSLKNLSIDLSAKPTGIGLLITNQDNGTRLSGINTYITNVENVGFNAGDFGIKVDSLTLENGTDFECILNRFENVSFIGCQTGFYCNTANSGFSFDNCYFSVPFVASSSSNSDVRKTALFCKFIGNLSLEHCLFVGNQSVDTNNPYDPPTDNSTILKTVGVFNNISFYDCQDENLQYMYQKGLNDQVPAGYNYFPDTPLVFRNCLIQSKLKFMEAGAVVFDSCVLNITKNAAQVTDGVNGTKFVRVYLKGLNNIYSNPTLPLPLVTKLEDFSNQYSQMIYESLNVGLPSIHPPLINGYYFIDTTRGAVYAQIGGSSVVVYNNLILEKSLVFTQLRTNDSGGAVIREVICYDYRFEVFLSKPASNKLSIGFKVEG
jgi:hypothetical protein